MPVARQSRSAYDEYLSKFLAARGADIDAHQAMFALYRAHVETVAAMEAAALRPLGLTHAGFLVLMSLWTMGPQETRNLATMQKVSKPSIVSSVDTLERGGLVRRVRSDVDRRLVSVEITPEGTALIERASDAWHARVSEIASVLTKSEQHSLAAMLRKLELTTRVKEKCNDAQAD